jgi:quercetin dioxygenase-like cupin family protein
MLEQAFRTKTVSARQGTTYQVVNDLVTFKAVAADTNGAYALFETRMPPGQGIPLHRQRYEDEAFWVLEGVYTVTLDNQELTLEAGAYAFVPRGTVHAYHNSGAMPARMLILINPGGIHERFFAEVGALVGDSATPLDPPDFSRLLAVAPTYGIEMLPRTGRPRNESNR